MTAIAWPWLKTRGIDPTLVGNGIPAILAGVIAAVTAFAVLGVGLGALLRDQVAAVVGLLVYLFVAEPVVTRIPALHDWSVYLPGPSAQCPDADHLDRPGLPSTLGRRRSPGPLRADRRRDRAVAYHADRPHVTSRPERSAVTGRRALLPGGFRWNDRHACGSPGVEASDDIGTAVKAELA